ncbi:hypothetical protein RHABOEDO_001902 (plasmid) [Candidatus Rhabdochlamydia oedothoracis]|uniref:Uncharacterized protein n=1 Tax=Candidatus Rhabdochlamydia oedothoracis TaxID=2720720 RepID=A0ABX8V2R0_9BACT|nr:MULTISPECIES: hypothetical protein [Rhabdochlamydia]KAG6559270.1 hypothetical protein RHOW815_000729 [Candidatus Rhabdochlamydia sp. W815]QYF49503.1 hypothetical protein RHABOEDO_001902 [Candidatus Rhabdochlamydia oedothoracis]
MLSIANGNINLGGGNIAVIGNSVTNTLAFFTPDTKGITWVDVTSSPIQMSVNTGYMDNFSGSTLYKLPASSAFGDVLFIVTAETENNGWMLNMAPTQQVCLGAIQTTFGGTITSLNSGDTLYLVCSQANIKWVAISFTGNFGIT